MDERDHIINKDLRDRFNSLGIKFELALYSKALFDTITQFHDSEEYRLPPTVTTIRNSFESGDLDMLIWVAGVGNIYESLANVNIRLFGKPNNILDTGIWSMIMNGTKAHDGDESS